MRIVALAIIAGIAIFMGWKMLSPECAGSKVTTEAQCVNVSGFDRAFCARAFANTDDVIVRAGNMFPNQQDCQVRFLTCIEFPGVHGWTPKPEAYCVVRGSDGALAQMFPTYKNP